MAERKISTSPNHHSKGGAGDFTKQIQRKFSRAQEKVLQRFGKSEEKRDAQFDIYVQNLQEQQSDGHRIYKDLKAYLNAVRVMRDASSRLFQSLFDIYELDWEGVEDLGAVAEGEDLLWNDYEVKLRDQALRTMESYMSQFPDIRERVAKRGRKLVDYDILQRHLESLQNAKKRDDIKIDKAEEEMKITKTIFEDINRELKEELPVLYDSRIGCYVTVFQAISNLKDIFYKEMSQNNKDLQNIMMNLKAQHPDKSFVIKNFNRGTLKSRSLKDVLSPRSLRASFSEFQMNYSSRGTLRREYSFNLKPDNGLYESGSPEVLASPTRPKPLKNTSTSMKSLEVEIPPSSAPEVDDTKASDGMYTITKKDEKQENENTETKQQKLLPALNQDGEMMSLDHKDDLSSETCDENMLDLNINHCETADNKVLSFVGDLEEHSTHPEELKEPGSGLATNLKGNIETPEISCKDPINYEKCDEIKDNI